MTDDVASMSSMTSRVDETLRQWYLKRRNRLDLGSRLRCPTLPTCSLGAHERIYARERGGDASGVAAPWRVTRVRCPIPFDPNRPNGVFLPFVHLPRGMSRTSQSQQPKSFEAALAELEEIVHAMEAGQLPLEQTIAAYRRGAQLLQFCQNALKDAAQQVKLLDAGVLRDFSVDGESAVADGRD